jgi:DNA-binding response OmpR family regulator
MGKIFIVEDDRDLGRGLKLALRDMEFEIALCFDLRSAREEIAGGAPDLVLLDVNLPDGSGLELLREIKAAGDTPVILLTANDTEMDVVAGLDGGADDYITKPFSLAILRARVKAQLRRNTASTGRAWELDGFRFDFDRMEFYRGETPVELSRTEQKLLRLLVENRGITMPRSVLLDRVWSDGADYVDENALSVTVKRLRDKLDAAAYIKTVYGVGYVWTGKKNG